ncbi:MAG: DUF4381 domain-containing protein [Methylococcaceae bacterium]|nr:DUF4381 domain-containing protein [Methylococcaceae bacterium]
MEQLPLKDIHLPDPINWWPPAIGWWLLAVIVPLLIVAGIFLYKRLRRQTALKTASKLLTTLRRDQNRDGLQILVELSALLRRVAISIAPRADVAALSGEAWLAYLDASFPDAPFSRGAGRCLADVQYRQAAPEDLDLDALFALCEQWLKRQRKTPSGKSGFYPLSRRERARVRGVR